MRPLFVSLPACIVYPRSKVIRAFLKEGAQLFLEKAKSNRKEIGVKRRRKA